MKLNLAISGKILASVTVDPVKEKDNNYQKALRRLLIIRYGRLLKNTQSEPQFFLEQNMPSN